MTDVFISYTRDERSRCAGIAERLRALGLDVWFDAKLASGTSFDREIEERVRSAKAVLVLWSPKSAQSNWVRNEATIGQQRDVLVSVEIVPCTLPVAFTNTHTEFLHDANFGAEDPSWINILARLANLTGHPNLAQYRNLEPQATRRRRKFPVALTAIAALLIVSAGGVYASGVWRAAPPGIEPNAAMPEVDPAIATFAGTLRGQWAFTSGACPPRTLGQPVDMTPSTGAWFTVQPDGQILRTTSAGRTAEERIVDIQNGWMRTYAEGADIFYRVDEAGRLLIRVGDGEPARLEPCL